MYNIKDMKYWFSPTIKYKTFKLVCSKISTDSGPTPQQGNRMLWEMLKDRQINIFIDPKHKDDPIIITTKKIPVKAKMISGV